MTENEYWDRHRRGGLKDKTLGRGRERPRSSVTRSGVRDRGMITAGEFWPPRAPPACQVHAVPVLGLYPLLHEI